MKKLHPITKQIIKELNKHDKKLPPDKMKWATNILATDKYIRGLTIPAVKIIVQAVLKNKIINKELAFKMADELFRGKSHEDTIAGYLLLDQFKSELVLADLSRFKSLIKNYVNEWAHCDSFCIKVIGPFLFKNQGLIPQMLIWSKDKKMWVRRASAVCTLKLLNLGWSDQKHIYTMAKNLIQEKNPFIQKAVGWLLKVRGKTHSDEVIIFLLPYKNKIPRLILRYAMEKVPEEKRAKLLK